jgi:hypothetical protein
MQDCDDTSTMRTDDDNYDKVGELWGNDVTGAKDDETEQCFIPCRARA